MIDFTNDLVPLQSVMNEATTPRKRKSKNNPRHCEVCDIVLNSDVVYESHIKGQKHLKKMRTSLNKTSPIKLESAELLDSEKAVAKILSIAAANDVKAVFSMSDQPDKNIFNVTLTYDEYKFKASGTSINEANHIAAMMALEKLDVNQNQKMFSADSYPSALASMESHLKSQVLPTSDEVNKFVRKHLETSTTYRHNFHSLVESTINHLLKASQAINENASLYNRNHLSKYLNQIPPGNLNAIDLSPLDKQSATLLWAFRVGPLTLDLICRFDKVARIIVQCAPLKDNTKQAESNFFSMLCTYIPDSTFSNNVVTVKRSFLNQQNQSYELLCEITFLGLSKLFTSTPMALRRQIWAKDHIYKKKQIIDSLLILRNLSRVNKDGINHIHLYTWQVLVCLVCNRNSDLQCPAQICSLVLSELASGILLNGGLGISDPCDPDVTWTAECPPCAGLINLSEEDRLKVTKAASKIVTDCVHVHIANSRLDFLHNLLEIAANKD